MTASPICRRLTGAILLVVLSALLFAATGRRKMRDFEVYWTAGARAAAAAPLYRAEDEHYRFKYLPGFAVAMAPLSRLPLDAAKACWMALSVLCLAALVAMSVRSAEPSGISSRVAGTLTVIAMAKFFAHELVLGQANLAFGAICVGGLRALLARRESAAGMCFGLATLIKPYAVLFLPYLLATRRWRAAASSVAATGIVLVLPVIIYGASGTLALMQGWWESATETSVPLLTNADSISIFAMFAKWIGWGSTAAVLSFASIGILACGFLLVLLRREGVPRAEVLEVGLALTLIPLVTPQGWDYVLLLSTPLLALLIARASRMAKIERAAFVIALAVVAFSLYDIMGRAAYAKFMGMAVITVCYLVIVVVAVRARTSRVA